MSSESREQFRERIGRIYDAGETAFYVEKYSLPERGDPDWNHAEPEQREGIKAGAEAVYTEAWRDVLALMDNGYIYHENLIDVANELGIDLMDDTVRDMSGYTAADYAAGRDNQP